MAEHKPGKTFDARNDLNKLHSLIYQLVSECDRLHLPVALFVQTAAFGPEVAAVEGVVALHMCRHVSPVLTTIAATAIAAGATQSEGAPNQTVH